MSVETELIRIGRQESFLVALRAAFGLLVDGLHPTQGFDGVQPIGPSQSLDDPG